MRQDRMQQCMMYTILVSSMLCSGILSAVGMGSCAPESALPLRSMCIVGMTATCAVGALYPFAQLTRGKRVVVVAGMINAAFTARTWYKLTSIFLKQNGDDHGPVSALWDASIYVIWGFWNIERTRSRLRPPAGCVTVLKDVLPNGA